MSIETIQARYQSAGQDHLLHFFPKLSKGEQADLLAQLTDLDIERVNRIYKKAVDAVTEITAEEELIEPLPKGSSVAVGVVEQDSEWRKIGLQAIARGQVGVLLMAGGQGTRL